MGELIRREYRDRKTGHLKTAPRWYGDYRDGNGRRCRVPLAKDKTASLAMLADLERKADRAKAGLTDRFEEHAKTPLKTHLADWERSLTNANVTDKHRILIMTRCRKVLDRTKAAFLCDLSASGVMDALASLATEEGISAQTKAHTLQAVRQFGRWLVKDQRWTSNLLGFLTVPAASIRADQRHERRAFTNDELTQLIESTKAGAVRRQLTGPDRSMLYSVAVGTGLRVGELAALTPECFRDGWVTLGASETKNSLEATLPLPESLWRTLEPWLETRPAKKRLWGDGLYMDRAIFSKCLKFDMATARADWLAKGGDAGSDFLLWCDSQGRFADGHAFRTTYITALAQSGISPKQLQTLARHSDPKTTLKHYAKLSVHDLEGAVKCLPDLSAKTVGMDELRATGTEFAVPSAVPLLGPKGDILCPELVSNETSPRMGDLMKTPGKTGFLAEKRKRALPDSNRGITVLQTVALPLGEGPFYTVILVHQESGSTSPGCCA